MKQAVRVNDDQDDDSMGMGAAGYATVACVCVAFGILIAAILWLPELYRWWGSR